MTTIMIYSRVPPGHADGETIERQAQGFSAFAEEHGYEVIGRSSAPVEVESPVSDQTFRDSLRRAMDSADHDLVVVIDRDAETP